MVAVLVIVLILGVAQLGCHFEAKALGETRKQRRVRAIDAERRRLVSSIRALEKAVLGIDREVKSE